MLGAGPLTDRLGPYVRRLVLPLVMVPWALVPPPAAAGVVLSGGTSEGLPGQDTVFAVSIDSDAEGTVGVSFCVLFDAAKFGFGSPPSCRTSPRLGMTTLRGTSFPGQMCALILADLLSGETLGSGELLLCTVSISSGANPGTYDLPIQATEATGPDSSMQAIEGIAGSIRVVDVVSAPTPTRTRIPSPTLTLRPTPIPTKTPTPTATLVPDDVLEIPDYRRGSLRRARGGDLHQLLHVEEFVWIYRHRAPGEAWVQERFQYLLDHGPCCGSDCANNLMSHPALVLDRLGQPLVVVPLLVNASCSPRRFTTVVDVYSRRTEGHWERVDSIDIGMTVRDLSAERGPSGRLHLLATRQRIGTGERELVHGTNEEWRFEIANPGAPGVDIDGSGNIPVLAVDEGDRAHLTYRVSDDCFSDLWYATDRDGEWRAEAVATHGSGFGDYGSAHSLAVGSSGDVWIAAVAKERVPTCSVQRAELRVYHRGSGGWNIETVANRSDGYDLAGSDGPQFTGEGPVLFLDGRDRPQIAFSDIAAKHYPGDGASFQLRYQGQIRHAVRESGQWQVRTVYRQGDPERFGVISPIAALTDAQMIFMAERRTTIPDGSPFPESTYDLIEVSSSCPNDACEPPMPPPCIGDCSGSGEVTRGDVLRMVVAAITGERSCTAADVDQNHRVEVNEVVAATAAQSGCEPT